MTATNRIEPVSICAAEDRAAFVRVLDRIGDKWTILIIAELFEGPLRYNELQRRVGEISQRMLTLSLKALVEDGLVRRIPHATIPPRVGYELTQLGSVGNQDSSSCGFVIQAVDGQIRFDGRPVGEDGTALSWQAG